MVRSVTELKENPISFTAKMRPDRTLTININVADVLELEGGDHVRLQVVEIIKAKVSKPKQGNGE